ncbi:MAG TPA: DUF1707 domain-containing protein [Trebonia sp.]|jgi:hypothetical protein|nr:DUF1707 domain-containing protein [Trebonia sp.]
MADMESRGGAQDDLPATAGSGTLRASHADRDKVVEVLRTAAGDGRLSPEELDERLERALTAKTYAELAVLITDLPAAGTAAVPVPAGAAVTSAAPKDLGKIHVGSGSAQRDGRWIVPRELDVKITSGNVRLDFTQAMITQPLLHISAEVRSGGLTLITKPGIVVDVDEVSVRSGGVNVRAPWGHDVPVTLRVEITGSVRSGTIKARPPRRSFWQWLRRAPRPYAIAA